MALDSILFTMPNSSLDPLDTAIADSVELLTKFCVPLYHFDQRRRPRLIGTGFFVQSGKHDFLVSAAHVLDSAKSYGLFFYVNARTLRHLSGKLLRTKGEDNRDRDLIDVGVVLLSKDSVPPYPGVDKFPMDITYLRPSYRPRTGKEYVFVGYPGSKNKVNPVHREVLVAPYAFRNQPIDEDLYKSHGLNPQIHIAMTLDVRKGFRSDGAPQQFPDPHGMSGSPIAVLYDHNGPNDDRVFPVVGVATTYRKSDRLVFGTDIGYVVDAIRNVD